MAAAALAERFPALEPTPPAVAEAIDLIRSGHRYLMPMCKFLERGVCYHNGTLPHEIRRAIEDGLRQRQLLAVAATTTLAEGVDLPFRFTILVDWLSWQGGKQKPMPTLLFRNIAGRCGRAGMLTEGDTIVVDNPLGNPTYARDPNRGQIQHDIFLAADPAEVRRWSTITWRIGAAWIDWPHDSCNHTCCASGEV